MNCPECGGNNLKVMDTMPDSDNRIFRRRKCAECGSKFRTVEIMDDGSDEFRNAYADAQMNKSPNFIRRTSSESLTPEELERRKAYQKEYHKAYREKNRERLNAYMREYHRSY